MSKFVAPYQADVDTTKSGQVFYRQTTDPNLLQRATREIKASFLIPQNATVQSLVIVTWFRVGYRTFRDTTANKVSDILYTYVLVQYLDSDFNIRESIDDQ